MRHILIIFDKRGTVIYTEKFSVLATAQAILNFFLAQDSSLVAQIFDDC